MNKLKILISLCSFLVTLVFHSAGATESEQPIDFFELSPEDLANFPIEIASGSAKPAVLAAGVATVITAEKIKAMGATQLHQVLQTVPGLHVSIDPVSYDYIYSMRGIRNTNGAQVLLLLNGTRLSVPFSGSRNFNFRMPIEDIQRVEVIRGPGSAIYGADAFAGVINVITKRADDIDGTNVGGRVGNMQNRSAWIQHGGHYGGWDVAGSFQYEQSARDNSRIIPADTQTGIDQALGTQASLAPGPLDSRYQIFTGQLSLQRKYVDLNFWASSNNDAGLNGGIASALDPGGYSDSQDYLLDMRFSTEDWHDDLVLETHISYLYSNLDSFLNLFPNNTLLPIGGNGNINFSNPVNLVSFPDGYIGTPGRTQQIPSIEFSGLYDGFSDHQIRVSTEYRYETISTNESKNFGPGVIDGSQLVVNGTLTNVTGTPFIYLQDTSRSIWSISMQDEWSFADDWLLTTGLRYDYYSDFGSTVNPRVALVWAVNEQFTSKLLYGRAFRAPSFSEEGNINNPVLLGNPDLKPETINTVELAFNYIPMSNLSTGLNLYGYQISNLIQPLPNPGATSATVQNAGDQVGYGLEMEWDWRIIEQLGFSGNYAWQRSQDKRLNEPVAGVPEHQLYVAADWNFLPDWLIQTQLNWVGGLTRAASDPRPPLKDYEFVDLTLQRKRLFGHLDLAASVRNVFNNRSARELGGPSLTDDIPLPGRSYYFEMNVHF